MLIDCGLETHPLPVPRGVAVVVLIRRPAGLVDSAYNSAEACEAAAHFFACVSA